MATPDQPAPILCAQCNLLLETAKVNVAYLDNAFPGDLLKCPRCGQVYIPEDLALGKMAEVEKQLEDK
jgi:phage FluMu protein Com